MTIPVALLLLTAQQGVTQTSPGSADARQTNGSETIIRNGEASADAVTLGRPVLGRRATRLETRITPEQAGIARSSRAGINTDRDRYAKATAASEPQDDLLGLRDDGDESGAGLDAGGARPPAR